MRTGELGAFALRYVTKHEHGADGDARLVFDRGGAVIDGAFFSIASDENGVVGQADDRARLQSTDRGVLYNLTRVLMQDSENIGQQVAQGVRLGPAGQGFRHSVEGRHASLGVGSNHAVADTRERDAEPFRLLPQGVLSTPARGEDALSVLEGDVAKPCFLVALVRHHEDRKSTRLNSSHSQISYAVFCLKKKKKTKTHNKYNI